MALCPDQAGTAGTALGEKTLSQVADTFLPSTQE